MDIRKIDVGAIRGHADAATPGPWWAWDRGVGYEIAVGRDTDEGGRPARKLPAGDRTDIGLEADAEFIAHAREDIPALLAVVETVLRLHAADAAAAAEFAAGLDGSALEILRIALADEAGQRGGNTIVEMVRETVAKEYADIPEGDPVPVAVVFEPEEYDNGWYFDRYGTVFFSDGTHDEGVDFSGAEDEIGATYGNVGGKAALGVDLRTSAIEFDDYASNVYETLGVESLEVLRG